MQMVALPYLSTIRFSDADAGDFLHNQVSADVLGLASGESTFACYCEPKGRVLALMLVCRLEDSYYAVMAQSLTKAVTDRLRMYVLRSKVEIEVLEQYVVTGSRDEIAPQGTVIPVPGAGQWLSLVELDKATTVDDQRVAQWKAVELQRGIVWLCPETSGQFLPQWLGFDELGAVNFRKGCYPGQEIVARMHYLGKVKQHPRLLIIAAETCPGRMDKLELSGNGKTFGAVVVDCVQSAESGSLLFVVTRMEPALSAEQIQYQGQKTAVL